IVATMACKDAHRGCDGAHRGRFTIVDAMVLSWARWLV
ncbi:hypothetical protein A2U01_0102097, partial [Trifolium medium]|nr:hypothetical protein [Trifolium medium]